jgi:hypothetical protein
MSHEATVPAFIREYFGEACHAEHPRIASAFVPGKGWRNQRGYNKRVTCSWLRKLKGEGVTGVSLVCGNREADFTVAEILAYQAKINRQPLFGGTVV